VAQSAAVQQLEIEAFDWPNSTTAGGAKAKTMALRICENFTVALRATALTFRTDRFRRSQSLSRMNARPEFCRGPRS